MLRLIATSDTHFPFDRIPDGDVFLHCGDLMYGGTPDEWEERVESLAALPHKTKLFVPGNHDIHVELYPGPAMAQLKKAGVKVVGHPMGPKDHMLENGMRLVGLPWIINLKRWAFFRTEAQILEYCKQLGKADIVASHGPMKLILDGADHAHYGSYAFRNYQEETLPKYWIHGHVHESYGRANYNGTEVYNVAMCDEQYQQTNDPMIIELPYALD